jgi:tetratricopeptide (TPR) repeat protein
MSDDAGRDDKPRSRARADRPDTESERDEERDDEDGETSADIEIDRLSVYEGTGVRVERARNVYLTRHVRLSEDRETELQLIERLEQDWVSGWLADRVPSASRLELPKRFRPELVARPWARELKPATGPVPTGQSIREIYRQSQRTLLIVGKRGFGKTVTQLELARDLLLEARSDDRAPIPVVFKLSTWDAKFKDLDTWMCRELNRRYFLSVEWSRRWLAKHRIAPMLDGLDEVHPELRRNCVQAINDYAKASGLVVTALEEHCVPWTRLRIQAAIEIQQIAHSQSVEYLNKTCESTPMLKSTMQSAAELARVGSSPLMLHMVASAFDVERLVNSAKSHDSQEEVERVVFATFVDDVFARQAEESETEADLQETRLTLARLARGMTRHNTTLFAFDQLQPSWLVTRSQIREYVYASRALAVVAGTLLACVPALTGAASTSFETSWLVTSWLFTAAMSTCALMFYTVLSWERRGHAMRHVLSPFLLISVMIGGVPLIARALENTPANDIKLLGRVAWSRARWKGALTTAIRAGAVAGIMMGLLAASVSFIVGIFLKAPPPGYATTAGVVLGMPLMTVALCFMGAAFAGGFGWEERDAKHVRTSANDALRGAARAAVGSSLSLLCLGAGIVACRGLGTQLTAATIFGAVLCYLYYAALNFVLSSGTFDLIGHFTLRELLHRRKVLPRELAKHVERGVQLKLLQRTGGSYAFFHPRLQEFLAEEGHDPREEARIAVSPSEPARPGDGSILAALTLSSTVPWILALALTTLVAGMIHRNQTREASAAAKRDRAASAAAEAAVRNPSTKGASPVERARSGFNAGLRAYQSGRVQEAIDFYTTAIAVLNDHQEDSLLGVLHDNVGYAYFDLGELDEALMHWETALPYAVDQADVLAGRGLAFAVQGKREAALAAYREAVNLDLRYLDIDALVAQKMYSSKAVEAARPLIELVRAEREKSKSRSKAKSRRPAALSD